ncbi:exo-alpha-sialidase [Streptomyces sp. A7024]|uniref:exo-alpha-sialidase n=1 Tax=Streptomyces coryli TaxID=1128680 RepID=A0A6G4U4G2_9ACTN|nr:sialidase family protein [Streptomyces coryli]NGN66630.1 exo-alpha-sialidase [Streptomyces coryli]
MKRPAFLAASAALALGAIAVEGTAASAASEGRAVPDSAACTSSVPFTSGTGGYDTYRIPAVVKTPKGTVVAFAEWRVGVAGDTGNIDVVARRSTDGGCSWGPLTVVAAGEGDTRGNPAPVIDPKTGRLVLVTSYNSGDVTEDQIMRGEATAAQSRRVFVQSSGDDGRSFGALREITADVKAPNWRWYATGPGHAIALTRGPHAGRLVVPANHSIAPPAGSADTGEEDKYYGGHAIYSDDGGRSWETGFVDDSYDGLVNGNETTAAELPDGRLYFNTRDHNGTDAGNRADSYSSDGAATLDRPYAIQHSLDEVPVVQASVLQPRGRKAPLLFAGPSNPTAREKMAVWRSDDGGATFTKVTTLSQQRAAYSDLVQTGGNTVGLLYETGVAGTYETIEFRRLQLDAL